MYGRFGDDHHQTVRIRLRSLPRPGRCSPAPSPGKLMNFSIFVPSAFAAFSISGSNASAPSMITPLMCFAAVFDRSFDQADPVERLVAHREADRRGEFQRGDRAAVAELGGVGLFEDRDDRVAGDRVAADGGDRLVRDRFTAAGRDPGRGAFGVAELRFQRPPGDAPVAVDPFLVDPCRFFDVFVLRAFGVDVGVRHRHQRFTLGFRFGRRFGGGFFAACFGFFATFRRGRFRFGFRRRRGGFRARAATRAAAAGAQHHRAGEEGEDGQQAAISTPSRSDGWLTSSTLLLSSKPDLRPSVRAAEGAGEADLASAWRIAKARSQSGSGAVLAGSQTTRETRYRRPVRGAAGPRRRTAPG